MSRVGRKDNHAKFASALVLPWPSACSPRGAAHAGRATRESDTEATLFQSHSHRTGMVSVKKSLGQQYGMERVARRCFFVCAFFPFVFVNTARNNFSLCSRTKRGFSVSSTELRWRRFAQHCSAPFRAVSASSKSSPASQPTTCPGRLDHRPVCVVVALKIFCALGKRTRSACFTPALASAFFTRSLRVFT